MRILALETSGYSGDVALLEEDRVVAEFPLPEEKRTAQMLAPGIAEALATAGWQPRDVNLVAVTIGPGSFTGLRVGVTTAKTYAYAAGCEVLGIDTLEVLAAQVTQGVEETATLWAVLDAQRQQLFASQFCIDHGQWKVSVPAQIYDQSEFLTQLAPQTLVTGSGLAKFSNQLPAGAKMTNQQDWPPRAVTVGRLAWRDYQAGRRDDLWRLAPHYLRPSAAEEQQNRRIK
jgi:tRNA threonylcarbamoyladenosine biosynthesis protein TsaB